MSLRSLSFDYLHAVVSEVTARDRSLRELTPSYPKTLSMSMDNSGLSRDAYLRTLGFRVYSLGGKSASTSSPEGQVSATRLNFLKGSI